VPEGRACPGLVEEQALCGFQTVDTSNLELESDGFEETQVRLRFVVPNPCVSKTEMQEWVALVCAGSGKAGRPIQGGLGRLAE